MYLFVLETKQEISVKEDEALHEKSGGVFHTCVLSQKLQGYFQKHHSVDKGNHSVGTNNYSTEIRKHKTNSNRATFGNMTLEKLLFSPYATKIGVRVITRNQQQ
jgi:hypothetical protein